MRANDAAARAQRERKVGSAWPLKRELSLSNLNMTRPKAEVGRQQPTAQVILPPRKNQPATPPRTCSTCLAEIDRRAKRDQCRACLKLPATKPCAQCTAEIPRRSSHALCAACRKPVTQPPEASRLPAAIPFMELEIETIATLPETIAPRPERPPAMTVLLVASTDYEHAINQLWADLSPHDKYLVLEQSVRGGAGSGGSTRGGSDELAVRIGALPGGWSADVPVPGLCG